MVKKKSAHYLIKSKTNSNNFLMQNINSFWNITFWHHLDYPQGFGDPWLYISCKRLAV